MSAIDEFRRAGKSRRGGASRASSKRDGRAAAFFLGPWFVGLILITAGPLLASLVISFTDFNLLQSPEFSGLDNYRQLADDPRLMQSLFVTVAFVFISVPIQLALALALAVVLNRGLRGLSVYRAALYLPSVLASSVAIGLLWRQMFGADGLANQVLALVGIEGIGWISNPSTSLGTLILLNVWTFGAPMVIFLAGLRQIPEHCYEAARLDGASGWRQFRSITIPLLTPIILFNVILQTIAAFQYFTQAFIISGGRGAPSDSLLFITLYLYEQAFVRFNMGYASAIGWVLVAVIAVFTAINFALSRFWVFYND